MKFVRRKELDVATRINILILALSCQGIYGARTALANQYNISRSFLYQLTSVGLLCLQELFSNENISISSNRLEIDSNIALLRLEGSVSISGISEILKMQGYESNSTGMVSEHLKYLGQNLPHTLYSEQTQPVFYSSDEIFANDSPILITIDPVSTTILRIELATNRKAETWQGHFNALDEQQFVAKGLSSDRGNGLVAGYQASYIDAVWCSDHFHEFRSLIRLRSVLEKQAYAAIAIEDERLRVFNNARSEGNLQKRLKQLDQATHNCEQKMAQYQHINDVLDLILPGLYFFDLTTGAPRTSQSVKTDLLIFMDLLDELSLPKLQVQTQNIRAHLDDICICYQQVEDIYQQLSQTIPETQLNYISIAWQHDHQSHQHKASIKQYHQSERDYWLNVITPLLGDNAETQINQAFELFNSMVRSSSLIEMVNSQIRPYLNSCKGQITQEHLNLIMFYHNHHSYKTGKRKGKAPIELLTGKKLEKNWLELLFDTVSKT